MAKCGGVDEERRHKVHGVRAGQLTRELGRPSLRNRALAERARLAGERRREYAAVVLELIGVVCVARDVGTERGSVSGCRAGERTGA